MPFLFFSFWTKILKCSSIFVEGSNIFVSDFNHKTKTIKSHSRNHTLAKTLALYQVPTPPPRLTTHLRRQERARRISLRLLMELAILVAHLLTWPCARGTEVCLTALSCPVHPSLFGIASRQDPIFTIKSAEPVSWKLSITSILTGRLAQAPRMEVYMLSSPPATL